MDYNNQDNRCPFPVGSIFITTDKMIPSWIRQGTYRVPFWKGRCLVCVDDTSQTLKEAGHEFWSAWLTTTSVRNWDWWSTTVTTWTSNYQPSITVYMRKRVSSKSDIQSYNAFNITDQQATDRQIYWYNAIIDANTQKAKQPDPYNP